MDFSDLIIVTFGMHILFITIGIIISLSTQKENNG